MNSSLIHGTETTVSSPDEEWCNVHRTSLPLLQHLNTAASLQASHSLKHWTTQSTDSTATSFIHSLQHTRYDTKSTIR